MKNWQTIFNGSTFRIFDHTATTTFLNKTYTADVSFAVDDALSLSVSEGKLPAMRLWVHDKTVVLGIPDTRLPHLAAAIHYCSAQGYQVIVRNSGGLAVVLDSGVLNISLILPSAKHLGIHACYEVMVQLIKYMLRDLTTAIEAYEIKGSYCPGDYDLSIAGKKFAGISQRRVKEGAAVQIYLDVAGNSQERATLIRNFYERGVQGENLKNPPPNVRPETMASLSELLGQPISVNDMRERAISSLQQLSENLVIKGFDTEEQNAFSNRYLQMEKRNETIQSILQS